MHVIVVGAGEVGSYVADRLSREAVDVVLVERDPEHLRAAAEELDVLTVLGNGSHPKVLELAGLDRADLVVAVTNSDESNLITALIAKQHGVPRTVVRVEAPELRSGAAEQLQATIGADLVIDPDEEVVNHIVELLEFPGASEVEYLADHEVVMVGAKLGADAPIAGRTLIDIARVHGTEGELLFGPISRDGETIIPGGHHELLAGDQVRVLCGNRARGRVMGLLGLENRLPRRILLLGGGRTAQLLADRLSRRGVEIALVEKDKERCRVLAEGLRRVTVICGDFTDANVLVDAEVGRYDVVVALGGEDHSNSLACLFAKAQGAAETVAVVHRLELLPLLRQASIDASLSPRTATANGVLRFVRGGIAGVRTFLEGAIEVLEFDVASGSRADGAVIAEMRLPDDVLIGAIVHGREVEIASGRSELHAGDLVIVFAMSGQASKIAPVFS